MAAKFWEGEAGWVDMNVKEKGRKGGGVHDTMETRAGGLWYFGINR